MERRSFCWNIGFDDIEIRENEAGDPIGFRGYLARFNELSEDLGGFREKIQHGTFAKTIKESDIRFLLNHDPNIVLGRNTAGTLRLRERSAGLWFENDLPDTTQARDLMVNVKAGNITQGSFGFKTVRDKWKEDAEPIVRTLQEVKLIDVSLVTFPAYPSTSVSARFSTVAEALATAGEDGGELNSAELRALATHAKEVQQYLSVEPPTRHSADGDVSTPPDWGSRLKRRWLELAAR